MASKVIYLDVEIDGDLYQIFPKPHEEMHRSVRSD
jgi:hypothetical protein